MMPQEFRLDSDQIDKILDKLVPLIAKEEDQGLFRGMLRIYAERVSSPQFTAFVSKLLKEASR